jgi:Bacterial self-protective colicin-like immunity
MTDDEARRSMLAVIARWLHGEISAEAFVLEYWQTRRSVMDTNWSAFSGRFGQLMDPMDGTVNAFNPDPDRADFEIAEDGLRNEVMQIYDKILSEMPELADGAVSRG